jgi:HK97 family phage prohead protease
MTDKPTEQKSISAYPEIKTAEEETLGIVEHLISVFGILDLGRDICHPGSFTKTLAEQKGRVRVVDTHRRSTIMSTLGVPLDIWEVPRSGLPKQVRTQYPEATGGVMAKTQFLLETPEGLGAFLRIKAGAVTEFSFGYDALDEDITKDKNGKAIRNLRTIRLREYGPVVFGMNPATVTDVKAEPPPCDYIKAVDEGENTIRIRVKSTSAFEEGSFKTVTIGKKSAGIKAVMGRLKGEKTTTVQSYLFDKSKWTTSEAKKWVKEHGTSKALNYTEHILEVRNAFNAAYNATEGPSKFWIKEIFDEFLVVQDYEVDSSYYQVGYTKADESISFTPRGEWIAGKYVFVTVSDSESSPDEDDEEEEEEDQGTEGKTLEVDIELEQLAIELARAGPA